MAGQGKYTVIELSEAVGVARTTINDWLSRHSQYIDFEMQGRRKIYTDASVEVLKEISNLRNSGLSSYEIEAELSKKHPVRGEPQPAQDPAQAQPSASGEARPPMGQQPASSTASSAQPSSSVPPFSVPPSSQPNGEEFALVAKRQTDEISKLLGESFQGMAQRIEQIERDSKASSARAARWYLVSLALLLAILVAGVFAAIKIEKTAAIRDELAKAEKSKAEQFELLRANTVNLGRQSDDLRRNVEALERGLVEQRADFDKALSQAKSEGDAAKNAELARMRDNFAAERLELLKKLESADPAARESLIKSFRDKLSQESSALGSGALK